MPSLRRCSESTIAEDGRCDGDRLDHRGDLRPVEARQTHLLGQALLEQACAPRAQSAAGEQFVCAVGADDEAVRRIQVLGDALEHVEAELVRPVEVVEPQHHRLGVEQFEDDLREISEEQAAAPRRVSRPDPLVEQAVAEPSGRLGATEAAQLVGEAVDQFARGIHLPRSPGGSRR